MTATVDTALATYPTLRLPPDLRELHAALRADAAERLPLAPATGPDVELLGRTVRYASGADGYLWVYTFEAVWLPTLTRPCVLLHTEREVTPEHFVPVTRALYADLRAQALATAWQEEIRWAQGLPDTREAGYR